MPTSSRSVLRAPRTLGTSRSRPVRRALEVVRCRGGRRADAAASDARRRRLPREARLVPGEEARAQGQDARASELRPRPPVTAYVTREHPETGSTSCSSSTSRGARVQRGRSRGRDRRGRDSRGDGVSEVMEETGIEAEFVRVVGVGENPVGHYVQLKRTRLLPETWEHIREDGPVHCRWIPVSARAPRSGACAATSSRARPQTGRRLRHTRTRAPRLRACGPDAGACRARRSRRDARGGARARDQGGDGRRRIEIVAHLADAAEFEELYGRGDHESRAFHAVPTRDTPDAWTHRVSGTGMDAGMAMPCRWVALEERPLLWGRLDPLVERLLMSITDR